MGNSKGEILARMLAVIPDNLDKSEGSFIWDALAAVATEMTSGYEEITEAKDDTYVKTSEDEYLDRRVEEKGVTREAATYAIGEATLTGTPGKILAAGISVSTVNGVTFKTTGEVTIGQAGTVKAPIQADAAGSSGVVTAGTITVIPISVEGLTAVTNEIATYGGEDEETDSALKSRYFEEMGKRAQDGNIAQYKKWAADYAGIGRVKIFPLWNGADTVKISILDSNNGAAVQGLVDDFQEYLDPGKTGLGNGAAPIGSVVTVSTASAVTIGVVITAVLNEGYTEITGVQEAIRGYFADIAYLKKTVSYLGLAGRVQDVACIDQLKTITLNSATADIILGDEQIPVLGTYNGTVVTE